MENGLGKNIQIMEKELQQAEETLFGEESSAESEGEYITRTVFTSDRKNKVVRWTTADPKDLKPIFTELPKD